MKNYLKLTSILPLAILLLIPAVSSAETIAGYQSYSHLTVVVQLLNINQLMHTTLVVQQRAILIIIK